MQTALERLQLAQQKLEATRTISDTAKRRRVDLEQPTGATKLDHIDLDNTNKREARGAFPRWKCWALVQVAPQCVLLCVDCCCVHAGILWVRLVHEGGQDAAPLVVLFSRQPHAVA